MKQIQIWCRKIKLPTGVGPCTGQGFKRRRRREQEKVEEIGSKKALPLSATYVNQTTFSYLRFASLNQTPFNIQELKELFEIDCLSSTKHLFIYYSRTKLLFIYYLIIYFL